MRHLFPVLTQDFCSPSFTSKSATKSDTLAGLLPLEHTHTCAFYGPLFGTTWVSRYQIGKTNLDFTEAEWQWHPLSHMQVCTSLQSDNHASTPPLGFLQVGCPSCRPTNSVKALRQLPLETLTNKCHKE